MTPKKVNSALPGPADIYREVLPNGITVLTRANFNSPSVTVKGYFDAGSLFDPDEKMGLADFVTSALMRGTKKHSFDEMYNILESAGASLGFSTGVHKSGFNGRALAEDLPLLLSLLAEALTQPVFPKAEMEKLRAQILTGLAISAEDTSEMASETFDKILYRDHPYSRPEEGTPETVKRITRDDLMKFHRECYGPRGMVIAVVGAVEAEEAVRQVKRALGGWQVRGQKEPPALPDVKPLRKTVSKHHRIPGKSQSDIVIGTNGPKRRDAEYMPASLGNNILGQFGMMGRIGDAVREKAGLAYYAYSSLNAGIGPGSWEVSAGVNPTNVAKATRLIVDELKRFVQEGVTEDELADSQANFIGRLPLSLESNGGVAGALLNIERYDLGLDYYLRYADLVKAVTREEVLLAARKYIDPERLAIAVAGP
ncbi:MAG: M16 family metallopeptidase [Chloroflexota bacterium]|nr:insulinase family protein [Chloroflexota bacterium]MBI5704932.1 insulinase family protein [Chloroflexota bacterium]